MKTKINLIWVFVLTVSLISTSWGICETSPLRAKEGKEVLMNILSHHKRLDKSYRDPYVSGGGTSNPICCIIVPSSDWKSLSESKIQALADYTASLINKVKANPLKYSGVINLNFLLTVEEE